MFTTILYYVIIITGTLYLAASIVRLIDKLDHPKTRPAQKNKSATAKRSSAEKAEKHRYIA